MDAAGSADARRQSGHVGAEGESLVLAKLLSFGYDVARPLPDRGADFVALRPTDLGRAVPIQVKTTRKEGLGFERRWFAIERLILVHVWLRPDRPRFFLFDGVGDVEQFLGTSAATPSWKERGRYTQSQVSGSWLERLRDHEDQWGKVTRRLEGEGS